MKRKIGVLAAAIAVLLVSFASNAMAQATKPAPAGGPREGIKVHGHWVIEVRNPDGTLATRRVFKNALVPSFGDELLAGVLSREFSLGAWAVSLLAISGAQQPCGAQGCGIIEAGSNAPSGANIFPTLTLVRSGAHFVLNGTATAASNSLIATVRTSNLPCQGGVAPSVECSGLGFMTFTSVSLASPIPVAAGQIIQVTVTISFS